MSAALGDAPCRHRWRPYALGTSTTRQQGQVPRGESGYGRKVSTLAVADGNRRDLHHGTKRLAAGEPDCSTDQLSQRLSLPVESTPSAEG